MWAEAIQDLQAIDSISMLSIAVKTATYLATLLAVGSIMVPILLKHLDAHTAQATRRLGLLAALAALISTVARIPLRSNFLTGGNWAEAMDLELLQIVLESPLGNSVFVRVFGLALLMVYFCLPRLPHLPKIFALIGAVIVCYSFSMRGHALNDPTYIFTVLITVHTLALSYWVGGFYPLHTLAHAMQLSVGDVTEEFGKYALWAVTSLVTAGSLFMLLLVGNPLKLFTHTYGQLFIIKLLVFGGLLGLAAINRIKLTPALMAGDRSAGKAICLSIKLEILAFVAILLITATFTTISSAF